MKPINQYTELERNKKPAEKQNILLPSLRVKIKWDSMICLSHNLFEETNN